MRVIASETERSGVYPPLEGDLLHYSPHLELRNCKIDFFHLSSTNGAKIILSEYYFPLRLSVSASQRLSGKEKNSAADYKTIEFIPNVKLSLPR
jgi:hypothetical protein